MKIFFDFKNSFASFAFFALIFALAVFFVNCKTTKVESPSFPVQEIQEVQKEEKTEQEFSTIEPELELEPELESEPAPQEKPEEISPFDSEYARSVGSTGVTKDTFEADKNAILGIIKRLDSAMKDLDYKSWISYVAPESIAYWSNASNLKKAQSRLPVKGLKLGTLNDYFRYVFVPSRTGRKVSEIRYISDKEVKAVQVHGDQDIIYYYFNKIDDRWQVFIPPISN